MARLFVVCGHGAGDPGAGGFGYTEAERVRALAAEMQRQAGDQMILGDTSINWYASNKFSTIADPGIPVLELHMDSASPSARGGHVIIDGDLSPDADDLALAAFISDFFPGRAQNLYGRNDLRNPNVCARRGINYRLMECGFISNQGDLEKFNANLSELAAGILHVFGIGTVAAAPAPSEPVKVDPVEYPPRQFEGTTVYRLYNPNTGEHHFTPIKGEADGLAGAGWLLEGEAWSMPAVRRVYRLYNPHSGWHMLTVSFDEAVALVDAGWKHEPEGDLVASAVENEHPVYRLYNAKSGQHLFTESEQERKALALSGMADEGVAFYAM